MSANMTSSDPESSKNKDQTAIELDPTNEGHHKRARKTASLYYKPSPPAHAGSDDDQHRIAEEQYWKSQVLWQAIGAIATIAAFGAGAFYVHYAHKQAVAMNEAVSQTKRQIDDAEAVQRAQLVIEDFTVDSVRGSNETQHHSKFTLRNVGHTVADEINIGYSSGWGMGLTQEREKGSLESNAKIIRPDPAGWSLGANDNRAMSGATSGEGNAAYDAVLKGAAALHFQIFVAYRDIFGKPRLTSDCLYFNASAQKFTPCAYARYHE